MGARALPLVLGSVLCLALSGPGTAGADDLSDLGSNLAGTNLPDVQTPSVGGLPSVQVHVPSVDEVVNTVDGVADGLTGGGGGGGGDTAEPPQSTPSPGDGNPTAVTPASTAPVVGTSPATQLEPTQQSSRTPPAEQRGAAGGASAAGAAAAGASRAPNRSAADEPVEQPATEPAPFIQAFEKLPWSLFAVIAGLALVGLVMSGRSAGKTRLARRLRRQRGELQEDVGALQSALLPAVPERIGDVKLSVAYRPAEGPAAGGDFHDILELDENRIAIVVGDVCGHGREALSMTALVHYTVRAYLEAGLEPREALRLADEALAEKLGDDFVAVVAAIYDASESTLQYATAGHPTPLIAGERDHVVGALTPPPIGVGLRTGARQTRVSVRPDSLICFFTDGLIEARVEDEALLGRAGLAKMLADEGGRPEAGELLEWLRARAETRDDLTACMLAPATATGDGSVVEELDVDRKLIEGDKLARFLGACGLERGEVKRAVEMTRRRVHLADSARILVRSDGPAPRWELTGVPARGERVNTEASTERPSATPTPQPAPAGLSV